MSEAEPAAPPLAAIEELASGGPVAAGTTLPSGIPGRATSERVQRVVAYAALLALTVGLCAAAAAPSQPQRRQRFQQRRP